jgi:phosphoribosylformylglycinamidine synthase PurS subunit
MKARVIVRLKNTVLDPQGKAIHHAMESLGLKSVTEVRQGKVFEIEFSGPPDEGAARLEIERIARDVLINPILEDFSYEIIG